MTGCSNAAYFSETLVWCAFQTGKSVVHDYSFHIADKRALGSLCFIFGDFIGCSGDKIERKTCLWTTIGMFGSIGDNRGNPTLANALFFVTIGLMSMDLQSIIGKPLNIQFTTTGTSISSPSRPGTRGCKVMAIFFFFLGGFISCAEIGYAGTLGVETGSQFVVMLWSLPSPPRNQPSSSLMAHPVVMQRTSYKPAWKASYGVYAPRDQNDVTEHEIRRNKDD
ncbi:hypothetical protein V8E55_007274 [Tylopilus felleus]